MNIDENYPYLYKANYKKLDKNVLLETNVEEERSNNILNQIKSMQLPVTVYENESSPKKKYLRTIYIEEKFKISQKMFKKIKLVKLM